jgi:hypothetical protein
VARTVVSVGWELLAFGKKIPHFILRGWHGSRRHILQHSDVYAEFGTAANPNPATTRNETLANDPGEAY